MSIFERVPMREKGCRYFLRSGPTTKFNRGWRTKAEVDAWLDDLRPSWRVGYMFQLSSADSICYVVKRNGQTVQP